MRVVIALGANLGDPASTLGEAVLELTSRAGLTEVRLSPLYRTSPVGYLDQPDFVNQVMVAETPLTPEELLDVAHAIEADHGRRRTVVNGPRTLDIDLVDAGGQIMHSPRLTLPHPRAHERGFVLVPWLAIDLDADVAGRGRVKDLVARLDTSGVRQIPAPGRAGAEAARPGEEGRA